MEGAVALEHGAHELLGSLPRLHRLELVRAEVTGDDLGQRVDLVETGLVQALEQKMVAVERLALGLPVERPVQVMRTTKTRPQGEKGRKNRIHAHLAVVL